MKDIEIASYRKIKRRNFKNKKYFKFVIVLSNNYYNFKNKLKEIENKEINFIIS